MNKTALEYLNSEKDTLKSNHVGALEPIELEVLEILEEMRLSPTEKRSLVYFEIKIRLQLRKTLYGVKSRSN